MYADVMYDMYTDNISYNRIVPQSRIKSISHNTFEYVYELGMRSFAGRKKEKIFGWCIENLGVFLRAIFSSF